MNFLSLSNCIVFTIYQKYNVFMKVNFFQKPVFLYLYLDSGHFLAAAFSEIQSLTLKILNLRNLI